jgi:hypothetical protein
MDNLPLFPDDDDPPFEPTPEDNAEAARLAGEHGPECPADYGHYCEDCDREMAEAWAARHDAEQPTDGWYLDLVMRAGISSDGWRD